MRRHQGPGARGSPVRLSVQPTQASPPGRQQTPACTLTSPPALNGRLGVSGRAPVAAAARAGFQPHGARRRQHRSRLEGRKVGYLGRGYPSNLPPLIAPSLDGSCPAGRSGSRPGRPEPQENDRLARDSGAAGGLGAHGRPLPTGKPRARQQGRRQTGRGACVRDPGPSGWRRR